MQKNYGKTVKIKENKIAPSFKLPSLSGIDFDFKNVKEKQLIKGPIARAFNPNNIINLLLNKLLHLLQPYLYLVFQQLYLF